MATVLVLLSVFYGLDYRLGEPEISALDLNRFPGREQAWSYWQWQCLHREWLQKQRCYPFSDRYPVDAQLDEHRYCLNAWDALADAWGQHKDPGRELRLYHLKRLRFHLGKEAYWKGQMPPLCPWWRFEER